ncbi:tumor suppressor ARF-like isoform X3 [Macrotis lagotis]|uniref:tumor suppressor ARF-like isoform X3 n=1 Tax=Macrotis lagotis TaxID=92651 RepID=UPI003D699F2D
MIRRMRVTIRVSRACRPHRIRTLVAKLVQALCRALAVSNQATPFQVLLIVRRKRDHRRPGLEHHPLSTPSFKNAENSRCCTPLIRRIPSSLYVMEKLPEILYHFLHYFSLAI